jgi:hypothetical protein
LAINDGRFERDARNGMPSRLGRHRPPAGQYRRTRPRDHQTAAPPNIAAAESGPPVPPRTRLRHTQAEFPVRPAARHQREHSVTCRFVRSSVVDGVRDPGILRCHGRVGASPSYFRGGEPELKTWPRPTCSTLTDRQVDRCAGRLAVRRRAGPLHRAALSSHRPWITTGAPGRAAMFGPRQRPFSGPPTLR